MGRRGSYSNRRKLIGGSSSGILIIGKKENSPRINLAEMNRDIANGVTLEKTLDYLKKTYKKGMTKEQLQLIDEQCWTVLAKQGDRHSAEFTREEAEFMRGNVVTPPTATAEPCQTRMSIMLSNMGRKKSAHPLPKLFIL